MSAQIEELLEKLIRQSGPLAYADLADEYESAMTPTAVAALVVRPTTVAAITVWNGENNGGKDLVMDRLFGFNLVSSTAQAFGSLWYCVHRRMDKPVNDIVTLNGTGDGSEPGSPTVIDQGATVIDDGWFPAGSTVEGEEVGALPGGLAEWEVKGRLKVPPGHGISLQMVAGTTGETFQVGASWHRHQGKGN